MAHRGPMKEMFGLLCMAVIFPRVHKSAIPKGSTGYIIDVEDIEIQYTTVPHFTPPPATGFQPFLLSFLASAFSLLGDELINMIAMWMLINALFPFITVVKRLILWAFRPRGRVTDGDATHITHQNTSSEARTAGAHGTANGDATDKTRRFTPSSSSSITAGAHDTADGDASNKTRRFTPSSSITAGAYDTANGRLTYKTRQFPPSVSQTITAEGNDDDKWLDAEQSLLSPEDIPENTLSSPKQDQVLAELRAESAEKDAQIATLNRAAEQHSSSITSLNRRNGHLIGSLRTALDPEGLYATTTDVVMIANNLARDRSRVSKRLKRQNKALEEARARQENGQLRQKDGEISSLSTENSRLNTRIERLEEQQSLSALDVETNKQAAREREKRLRDRTLAAESTANQAISQRQYDIVRNQLEGVVVELRQLKSDAADPKGRLSTEFQAERTRLEELQTAAKNAVEAQQQSESLLTKAKSELQLANEKIANTTSEALAQGHKARDAEKRARAAEEKDKHYSATVNELQQNLREARDQAKAAEEKDGQHSAAVNGLQQNLREARDQAEQWRERSERVALESQQREKMVKENGEASAAVANEKLIAEITGLKSELIEVRDKTSQAFQSGYLQAISESPSPAEPKDPEEEPSFKQGYNKAAEECGLRADALVQNAIQEAASKAGDQLAAALNDKEQEVKSSLRQEWHDRETEWRSEFDAEVEKKVAETAKQLRQELSTAVQRAIRAEHKASNPEGQLLEAQTDARQMYARFTELWTEAAAQKEQIKELEGRVLAESSRAETAETEVGKYKEGKANQDKRIKKLHDEIAAVRKSIPQHPELKAAELKAMENDNIRAMALIDEMVNRHYDHPTRFVLRELVKANSMIAVFKLHLQKPATRSNQEEFLKMLVNAEVDKACLEKLDGTLRLVLKKQCTAVNAKIRALREIIGLRKAPYKSRLLEEIWNPRGDEETEWNESEVVSSSESDEDEDVKMRPSPFRRQASSSLEARKAGHGKAALAPPPSVKGPIDFSSWAPKNVASAVVAKPTPAQPNHRPIFSGLSMLGAVMADKKSALPGLPPPEDEVIVFDSAPVAEDGESAPEPDDAFPAHTVPSDEEDEETIWENALYSSD